VGKDKFFKKIFNLMAVSLHELNSLGYNIHSKIEICYK